MDDRSLLDRAFRPEHQIEQRDRLGPILVRQSRRTLLGAFGLTEERVERRLAAILAADVVGYSRLMGEDEDGTLSHLKALRRELIDPKITEYRGRIVKTTGDGLLVEFPSVVDAVRCAVAVQRAMTERNADVPANRRIEFRIGINVGDIVVEDGDIWCRRGLCGNGLSGSSPAW